MDTKDIKFLRITHLRGPNIWTYRPVLEAWVDLGELEDYPSNRVPGVYERLTAWLPALDQHRCGVGEPGGFLERLREGTWPGHIMEHVALELQSQAGMKTGFGQTRSSGVRGVYKVAIRTRQEDVGRAALHAARDIVMAAYQNRPFDMAATLERLTDQVDSLCLGPSTASIVDAATDRRIPHIRLTDGNLVQLGYGKAQRRIWTAETERTSAIAEGISSDKDLTKRLLTQCGVPVPEGRIVASADEAWEAAQDIGLPVVVKPSDGNHSRGVTLNLQNRTDIEAAYAFAEAEGSQVMVERCIPGEEHRLLIVAGQMVAAARGETVCVTGDGVSDVAALVDAQINCDPRRGHDEHAPLDIINIGKQYSAILELQRQGLTARSVPENGRVVVVQRTGNMSHDVTDEVHPDVAAMAALAVKIVGLDIAGVDLVAQDISRPLPQQRGAIVEVNAGPSLLMHLKPAHGKPRPVGEAIVNHLFTPQDTGRIPLVGITGGAAATAAARLVAWIVHLNGRRTGLACADGLYLDSRQVTKGDARGVEVAQRLLINRVVETAVFESSPRSILSEGLAYDRCQVGVVTDVPHHADLAEFYIHEPEQMFTILRTQVDVVEPGGVTVLNANDERLVRMADLSDGAVVYFSQTEPNPVVSQHRQEGGRVVFIRDQQVLLCHGAEESALADTHMPALERLIGQEDVGPVALLAAIATAWALDIAPSLIRAGLKTFGQTAAPLSNHDRNPG